MIPLVLNKEYLATIDDEDMDLAGLKWSLVTCGKVRYAHRKVLVDGKRCSIYLHRVVAERIFGTVPDGVVIDHRNTDSLDNRRTNLRLATHKKNLQNRGPSSINTSGYKGVIRRGKGWCGIIGSETGNKTSDVFDTVEGAARWYDAMATVTYGEFAWTNFPALPEPQEL